MSTPARKFTRRRFLSHSAALAAGAAVTSQIAPIARAATAASGEYVSNWKTCPERVWIGPDYWSNPLQDWQIKNGRIECTNAAADRNVHLMVRSLGEQEVIFR
jgi:alkaline phosphatase D